MAHLKEITAPGVYRYGDLDASGFDDGINVQASNVTIYADSIKNAGINGVNLAFGVATDADAPKGNVHVYVDLVENCGFHGYQCQGKWQDVFFHNGHSNANGIAQGGHGFTAYTGANVTDWDDAGWEVVTPDVEWRILIAAFNMNYMRVIDRTVRTLDNSEWSVTGDYLHVFTDPASMTGTECNPTTQQCTGVHWINCLSENMIDFNGIEGHGFAFDGWSRDCVMDGCTSINNAGYGITALGAVNCRVKGGSILTGNTKGDIWLGANAVDITIDTDTVYTNYTKQTAVYPKTDTPFLMVPG